MSRKSSLVTRVGSATAADIFMAVGVALSWWESSEDVREGLFETLCGTTERVAAETFRLAPRPARNEMIKSALKHYSKLVSQTQVSEVIDALNKLEKLASTRNQIAHGYVSKVREMVDDNLTISGHFLVSTLTPLGVITPREENKKYALTADEIDDWTKRVRHERGRLIDVWIAISKKD